MLSGTATKWLKTLHIFLACVWGGGASSLFAIHCLFSPDTGPVLYARNMALIYVDSYIILPSSIGCLLTGLIYSQCTRWGDVKYHWLIVKRLASPVSGCGDSGGYSVAGETGRVL